MKEEMCEKVLEVSRLSAVVVFKDDVLMFICGYAPQCGRRFEENQSL